MARYDEAFLFLQAGTNPSADQHAHDHPGGRTLFAWVPDGPAAAKLAGELAGDGVRLIELYRGFDLATAAQVIEAVAGRAPVGLAAFGFGSSPSATVRRSVTIYRTLDADPARDRVVRQHSQDGWTAVIGAPDELMPSVAAELVEAGAELVEICGGTPLTTAEAVRATLRGRVPVSLVSWPFESLDGVHAFKTAYEAHS